MSRLRQSKTVAVPAATGGWNVKDPISDMPVKDAIVLDNIFPEPSTIRLRNGYREHTPQITNSPIETIHEHYGIASGARRLLAAINGDIYDCSTYGAAATNLTGGLGAFNNNRWSIVNFKGTGTTDTRSVWCNGADTPLLFDGAAFTASAYTVITDPTKLSNVISFKKQLFFLENDTGNNRTSIWYGAVNAFNGALTEFPVASVLSKGGKFLAQASQGVNTGAGFQDNYIVMSDLGELLIYSGITPATDFALIGRYFLPKPLGSRPFIKIDSDLIILTVQGAIPLSKVVTTGDTSQTYQRLTDKIQLAYNDVAAFYGDNFGWEGTVYPRGHYLTLNVPISGTETHQYVMNLLTGAWCRFKNQNGLCFNTFNDKLYFGTSDGKVMEADIGLNDNSSSIPWKIKQSFNYLNNPQKVKRITLVKPQLIGSEGMTFNLGVDVDFADRPLTASITTATTSGTDWGAAWGSPWDSGANNSYDDWYGVDGVGRAVALRMEGDFNGMAFQNTANYFIFEPGGVL